jgi:hypothetical protein
MIEAQWAREFAEEWIQSWNAHDLDRILSHYADDFEMSSPLIVQRTGSPTGVLKGKDAVGAYWAPSVMANPPLRFELIDVLVGIESLTLHYRDVGRRVVAETLLINAAGQVTKGMAQWAIMDPLS